MVKCQQTVTWLASCDWPHVQKSRFLAGPSGFKARNLTDNFVTTGRSLRQPVVQSYKTARYIQKLAAGTRGPVFSPCLPDKRRCLRDSPHPPYHNRCILLKVTLTSTYSVLRTLSEFACAKTCVSALGFSILQTTKTFIYQKNETTTKTRHVNWLRY